MAERGGDERAKGAARGQPHRGRALALGLVAILGAVLAGPIHRLGLLGARWSLGLFGVAALLGLVAAVLAAWGIALALLAHAWRSVVGSGLALLVAFMATAPLLIMVRTAAAVPVIHDVTTDTENPPAWVALAVGTRGVGERHRLRRPRRGRPAEAGLSRRDSPRPPRPARSCASRARRRRPAPLGWRIVAAAPAEGRLEASDTTRWFGFVDDIVVRVRPAPSGSRIDVRSASRVGRSDLGVNARRIRAFLAAVARPGPK